MESRRFWLENLRRYKTVDQLAKSAFFLENGHEIDACLKTPQVFKSADAIPRNHSFLRIVQWNIEKGKRFPSILERLQTHEILKWADVVVLNEADQGMNRSENRDVALELAAALGMHMVFGPAHFELTKGTGEELTLEGENRESLQGNAILSRYPILETRIVQLPVSFEPYEFYEKRYGRRSCLWAQVQVNSRRIWIGSVHLELRNTPRCRARQIRHVLDYLPGRENEMYLLSGDLNTNSFRRGTAYRTLHSVSRLLFSEPARMKYRLLHPELGFEPLFDFMKGAGFTWEGLNSSEETGRAEITTLEEAVFLPGVLMQAIKNRLESYGGYLCFKLDWFLGKNIRGLGDGEKQDPAAGVKSLSPGTVKGVNYGPSRISDHLPIYLDIDIA